MAMKDLKVDWYGVLDSLSGDIEHVERVETHRKSFGGGGR